MKQREGTRQRPLDGGHVLEILSQPGPMQVKMPAHLLQVAEKNVRSIIRIGNVSIREGWNERMVKLELQHALGNNNEKVEAMLSFLSNFITVYRRRYREERQAKYMEGLGNMVRYVLREPKDKFLDGTNPYCSYAITLGLDGGLINGAVGGVNLALKKAGLDAREENAIIHYIGYKCPSKEKEGKRAATLEKEAGKFITGLGLDCNYLIKEVSGPDDFEARFFDMKKMLVAPGLRMDDNIYEYWQPGALLPQKPAPVYLLIRPLKGQDDLMPYEDLKGIVVWWGVYRGLEEVGMKPTPEILRKYVEYALENVQTASIGGTQCVKLLQSANAMRPAT